MNKFTTTIYLYIIRYEENRRDVATKFNPIRQFLSGN